MVNNSVFNVGASGIEQAKNSLTCPFIIAVFELYVLTCLGFKHVGSWEFAGSKMMIAVSL